MKAVIGSPFGSLSEESGLIYLLANYIRSAGVDTVQLRCNGIFSLCDRDAESNWRRGIESCVSCMSDQGSLAAWSGADIRDLSLFLAPFEVEQTKRWMYTISDEELSTVEFRGIVPWHTAKNTFFFRCGVEVPDPANKVHTQVARRLLLSALRMRLAARRFLEHEAPTLVLVAGGRDFISRSLIEECVANSFGHVLFQWQLDERCVRIHHPRKPEALSCELVMNRITSMRADFRTWPLELMTILDDILQFLEIPRAELLLPAAK